MHAPIASISAVSYNAHVMTYSTTALVEKNVIIQQNPSRLLRTWAYVPIASTWPCRRIKHAPQYMPLFLVFTVIRLPNIPQNFHYLYADFF